MIIILTTFTFISSDKIPNRIEFNNSENIFSPCGNDDDDVQLSKIRQGSGLKDQLQHTNRYKRFEILFIIITCLSQKLDYLSKYAGEKKCVFFDEVEPYRGLKTKP